MTITAAVVTKRGRTANTSAKCPAHRSLTDEFIRADRSGSELPKEGRFSALSYKQLAVGVKTYIVVQGVGKKGQHSSGGKLIRTELVLHAALKVDGQADC